MMHWRRSGSERGAAAVEFALVLPVLIMLLLGIVEFGRIYNIQISVTNAAREGARVMAIGNDPGAAQTAAELSLGASNIGADSVVVTPTDCDGGGTATVTVTHHVSLLTGYLDGVLPPINLTGTGVMLCGG